jgi:hypothetical protein
MKIGDCRRQLKGRKKRPDLVLMPAWRHQSLHANRERKIKRERERERETERETERESEREKERKKERESERKRERDRSKIKGKQTETSPLKRQHLFPALAFFFFLPGATYLTSHDRQYILSQFYKILTLIRNQIIGGTHLTFHDRQSILATFYQV